MAASIWELVRSSNHSASAVQLKTLGHAELLVVLPGKNEKINNELKTDKQGKEIHLLIII